DVWLQMAYITGFAVGPAFLYKALQTAETRHLWRVAVLFIGLGCLGLLGAVLFGELAMKLIFGPPFAAGAPYLVAGTAFGVLLFVDQIVGLQITAGNRPLVLAIKWAAACGGAVAVQFATYHSLGAYAGPTGLSAGILCGWVAVWAAFRTIPGQQ